MLYTTLLVLALLAGCHALSNGAPINACEDLIPGHHPNTPQSLTLSEYRIVVNQDEPILYETNVPVHVKLSAPFGAKMRGFLIVARATPDGPNMGSFTVAGQTDDELAQTNCNGNGLTHTSQFSWNLGGKRHVEANWTAGELTTGDVTFYVTFVKLYNQFWAKQPSAAIQQLITTTTTTTTTSTTTTTTTTTPTTTTTTTPMTTTPMTTTPATTPTTSTFMPNTTQTGNTLTMDSNSNTTLTDGMTAQTNEAAFNSTSTPLLTSSISQGDNVTTISSTETEGTTKSSTSNFTAQQTDIQTDSTASANGKATDVSEVKVHDTTVSTPVDSVKAADSVAQGKDTNIGSQMVASCTILLSVLALWAY